MVSHLGTGISVGTSTCVSRGIKFTRNVGRAFSSRTYVGSDIGQCGPPRHQVSGLVREKRGAHFIPGFLPFTPYEPLAFNS